MRLFHRILLFFVGVIVFQATLTILAITNVAGRSNRADARQELEQESAILFDSFHAWKRQLWVGLVGIASDEGLARALAASTPPGVAQRLREMQLAERVDAVVLRDARSGTDRVTTAPGAAPFVATSSLVRNGRDHPYLELRLLDGSLLLIGAAPLRSVGGAAFDLFLIKRIDAEFCGQLVRDRRSAVGIYLGDRYLVGSFESPPPRGIFDPREATSAILERYDRRIGRTRTNVSWQRMDAGLYLATFLSNQPFDERIAELDRTVLAVSGAAALLTVLLALFLARNITHPIADLLAGMSRIREGAWDTRVPVRGGQEISRLFHAFNEMARDLGASRASEQEHLRETVLLKEFNEAIVEEIQAGIAILDGRLVVEKTNRRFAAALGLDGAVPPGAELASLGAAPIDATVLERARAIVERRAASWSGVRRSRDGRVWEVRLHPFTISRDAGREEPGLLAMVEDVTARTELESKIFRAEKLATISMLSAGMAHEINNPVGSILTNVQNLIDEETDAARRVSLEWIEQEARRIARIVQELLHFASAGAGQSPAADVNQIAEEVVRVLRHSLDRGGRIRIDCRLAAGLPPAAVEADELTQVVVNLLRNSVQAIAGPGRILVRTRQDRGGGIGLAVSDTGAGIPPDVMGRIFDPFFTTKPDGEGTGLGLSVVYGIVTKYNGSISVRSRVGRGTRIALVLPCRPGEGS